MPHTNFDSPLAHGAVSPPSQSIISAVLNSGCVGPDIRYPLCYGLLLRHLKSAAEHWLHPGLSIPELMHSYERQHLEAEWRSESISCCRCGLFVLGGFC